MQPVRLLPTPYGRGWVTNLGSRRMWDSNPRQTSQPANRFRNGPLKASWVIRQTGIKAPGEPIRLLCGSL